MLNAPFFVFLGNCIASIDHLSVDVATKINQKSNYLNELLFKFEKFI